MDFFKDLVFDISEQSFLHEWNLTKEELAKSGWQIENLDDGVIVSDGNANFQKVKITLSKEPINDSINKGYEVLKALSATCMEDILVDSIPKGIKVDKVLIGYNWTMVRAGDLCGIARSPERGTQGARTIRPENGFRGFELHQLAQYLKSTDPLSRSLGLATVNTYYNRLDASYNEIVPVGGFASITPPGDDTLIIGAFRNALNRLPNAKIVEREPKAGDIPVQDFPKVVKSAKNLLITAQTLMNGSLELINRVSKEVPNKILLGPSAPLCPLLLDCGFSQISGCVIHDPNEAERFISESGTMIMLDTIVKPLHIARK
ncbi:MAG: hypothetical protein KGV43_01695 [Arcobacter sp.]|nr:hypothetical protein [Arcobacter sp.]